MEVRTHLTISQTLCGTILQAGPPLAIVELDLLDSMSADDTGLVHGGFIFGAADYAAMAAVNDANVVLASANVRFLHPSRVGEKLHFEARVDVIEGRKYAVSVTGRNTSRAEVFAGTFTCVVPQRHVLDS